MTRTIVRLTALAVVSLGLGTALAQDPQGLPPPGSNESLGPPTINAHGPLVSTGEAACPKGGLSHWITGTDPSCCGPLGEHNPLQTEIYLRSGFALTFGDGVMADSLQDGWLVQGGFRALCFNEAGNRAVTFDAGLVNIHNHGVAAPPNARLLNVPVTFNQQRIILNEFQAFVNSYNRTFVSFAPGFEWYVLGAANGTHNGGGHTLRVGCDAGGRWGTAKAEFRNLRHFTDTIGAAFAAVHADYEIPCGCCTYFMGLRSEYNYTWSDILQIQNKSDVQDVNVTLSLGLHY